MTLEYARARSLKTLETVKDFFARNAKQWLEACSKENMPVVIYTGFRSCEGQSEMYSWGRTKMNPNTGPKPGMPLGKIVTKAKAGQSYD